MNLIPAVSMAHRNRERGKFWFSAGAMEFFASKVESDGYLNALQTKAYFVTSEQFIDRNYQAPRLYSVRVFDMATAEVDTVGTFQQYPTKAQADEAARDAARQPEEVSS